MIDAYLKHDATGLAELVRTGEVSAAELTETAIARIEALNPRLNAVIHRFYDRAREAAKAPGTGPLAGVPFLLKDVAGEIAGEPTRQGSRLIPATPSPVDAELTRRFRAGGLNPLGKTNVPEFGLMTTTESTLYGPARNPWNPDHITGGSSGGSGAAVASGMVPAAHANDGGGSIRIPASCCGLVGLKPTRARTSFAPYAGDGWGGLEVEHVVTRSVRDSAAILDLTAGSIPGDPYQAPPGPASWLDASRRAPRPLRIAVSRTLPDGSALHPECLAAVDQAARLCADLGHAVDELDWARHWRFDAEKLETLGNSFIAIYTSSVVSQVDTLARQTGQVPSPGNLETYTLAVYEMGKGVTGGAYQQAWSFYHQLGREMAAWHETWDLALMPTLAHPPLKLGQIRPESTDIAANIGIMTTFSPFTAIQNGTGQPAINVPLHWSAEGLPVGTQLVGRFGDEATLLQLATQLEEAAPWEPRCLAMRQAL